MIKFKDYILNESVGYQKIDAEEIVKYKSQILAAASYPTIYRGMNSTGPYVIADGTQMNRVSRNTKNFYNMMMSEILPSWKSYPKRSQSFICSMDSNTASGYGEVYIVVPLENQDVGVCIEEDIWSSFYHLADVFHKHSIRYSELPSLNELMYQTMNHYFDQDMDSSSEESLRKHLSLLQKAIIETPLPKPSLSFNINMIKFLKKELETKSLIDLFDGLMDPQRNGFVLTKPYRINPKPETQKYNEVWMSGKVLFISEENYKETILSLRK